MGEFKPSARYLCLWIVAAAACQDGPQIVQNEDATFVDSTGVAYLANEVIVRLAPTTEDNELSAELAAMNATVLSEDSPVARQFGFVRLRLPIGVTADEAIDRLQRTGVVAQAERHYMAGVSVEPNDPDYGRLWGLPKIGAPAAWEHTTGDRNMVVAVIDTGIDLDHPDLAANVWVNPNEIAGNGIDDDGNGFVDDVHGWDFVNNDSNPDDDHGHGSHCAGTIGAVGNNGQGVAGVNWTVSLVGLKVLGSNGSGSLWGLAEAILYAARLGIPVASASLGCDGCNVSYVRSALDTFEESGGLFVAAAGNSRKNNDSSPHYPSSHTQDTVISVAATDANDGLASFSNYGELSVDVAAPGVGILSTTPGGRYSSFSGTSMATPHVAGAIALYWSQHPELPAAKVKEQVLASAQPLSSLEGRVLTAARLDVEALMISDREPPPAPTNLVAEVGARSDVELTWSAVETEDLAGYRVRWGTESGQYVALLEVSATTTSTRVQGLDEGGRYYFAVHALDAQGNLSPPSNEVSADPSDITAPPAVVDLRAEPVPGPIVDTRVVAASGEYSADYAAHLAVDGSPDTAWIAPRRSVPQEELLMLALNQPGEVSQVELRAPAAFPEFFPVGFDIEVSGNGADWTPVAGRRQVSVPAEWLSIRFPETFASHVRIRVTNSFEHRSGHFYAGLAEVRVRGPVVAPDSLRIVFTAVGDDPGEGTAARYDVRYARTPINEFNFDSASIATPPAPRASGVPIDHVFAGLTPETTYWVALRAIDDAGNVSPMSNVAVATTMTVPPGAITDLDVEEVVGADVKLTFTAVGGDGLDGRAARYDLRYSKNPITAANFVDATPVSSLPSPAEAGATERIVIQNLEAGEYYYFAVVAYDDADHSSALSNVVGALTENGPDDRPPARVDDLAVFLSLANVPLSPVRFDDSGARASAPADNLLDGDVTSVWQAPEAGIDSQAWVVLDLGGVHPVSQVRLHPGLSGLYLAEFPRDVSIEGSVDAANWTPLAARSGLTAPDASWVTITTPNTHVRYLRILVSARGLGACLPSQPSCGRSVTLSEIDVRSLTPELDADITWVAPGDDEFLGVAERYELRTSIAPLTEENFTNATPIAVPAPRPGGQLELHRLPALPPEATHYFGIRAIDNAGNVAPLSNIASITVPGVPPAPVTDLRASAIEARQATLSWTAPGDDGNEGTATAYDLRYATERIDPVTWDNATPLTGVPAPQPAGRNESFTVSGLEPDQTYYFALLARDERGQASVLSNVLRIDTLDGTAPGQITDLAAAVVDPNITARLSANLGPSSGAYAFETEERHLLDDREETIWLSPARRTPEPEILTFTFDEPRTLGRMRLRSAPAFTDLFPRAFRLEVRDSDLAPWQVVLDESGVQTPGGWEEWSLGTVSAGQARLVITEGGVWNNDHFAALAEVAFHPPRAESVSVNLSWSAPGDDDHEGTASRYDLRQAATSITEESFSSAIALSTPNPAPAGSLERQAVGGLDPDTRYCFAVRAEDEVGQRGAVSNSICVDTPSLAPNAVSDFLVVNAEANALSLQWTAPGAQADAGTAQAYEVRMSTARITVDNWPDATLVHGLPAPAVAGTVQTHRVTGLLGQTRYYFALVATNDRGQTSPLSNNAVGTTLDEVAPTVITDLALATDTTGTGRLIATWTAPGDGETGSLAEYDLRISPAPITASNFLTATRVAISTPRGPGQNEQATISGLAPEAVYYAAVRTRDGAGNWSALSNVPQGRTRDEAPGQVTNLAVQAGADDTTLTLTWTAPGDDGASGQAAAYDIRYSTTYISNGNFEQAAAVPNAPQPASGGSAESLVVQGLVRGTVYYFALKTTDERGNISPMSNWVSSQTSDTLPPAVITDLAAVTDASPGRVELTWTAPGDDGTDGLALGYELRYATAPITSSNFSQATLTTSQPSPLTAGTRQRLVVAGLPDESVLYFALRARDDANNWSAPSNSPSARTLDVAPRRVTDLRQADSAATSVTVIWTAPGDDAALGTATRYDLRWSANPIDDNNFALATVAAAPVPQPSGRLERVTIAGLNSDRAYYVAVRTVDDRDNWSPVSNSARVLTADTRAPARIGDLTASPTTDPTSLILTWSAPGDDDMNGVASRYEVRRSTAPIATEGEWNAATIVTGAPRPGAATAQEYFRVYRLTGETTYHFAIRAYDEADNASPLSNSAVGTTAPVAPARVSNLAATAGANQALLIWTAPGDDNQTGTATEYEIRYSTNAITSANFSDASVWPNPPSPAPAGTQQTTTITGLSESTQYYFALTATDDVGATSSMSNVVSIITPDLTPPAAPGALSGAAPGRNDTPLRPTSVNATSFLAETWSAEQLIDGDIATSWASAGVSQLIEESVVVDLGAASTIDRVELHPDVVYPELFPSDFVIETSVNASQWTVVAEARRLSVSDVGWLQFGFAPQTTRYVRVRATDLALSFGAYYAILAEIRVFAAAEPSGRVQLTWVAPGDDDNTGTAAQYELYVANQPFDGENLGVASPASGPPAPALAGTLQSTLVDQLAGEQAYWFGLRALDEAGNAGPLAGAVAAQTSPVAPAPVGDLSAVSLGLDAIELEWTAPGDDGNEGTATRYEIRYADWSLTSRSFPLATAVANPPTPLSAGGRQRQVINGLQAGTQYRFALVAYDDADTVSYLSNVALAETTAAPDVTPPGAVGNLVVRAPSPGGNTLPATAAAWSTQQSPDFEASAAVDGQLATAWSAVESAAATGAWLRIDLGALHRVDRVRAYPSASLTQLFPRGFTFRVSPDGLSWTDVASFSAYSATAGVPAEATFAAQEIRYVELQVSDLSPFDNGLFYAVVAELEAVEAAPPPGAALLTWTAPGDDGQTGQAAEYDLRAGPCPYDHATATRLTAPAPAPAGQPERVRVAGLDGTMECFGLQTLDEAGNRSSTSNVATF